MWGGEDFSLPLFGKMKILLLETQNSSYIYDPISNNIVRVSIPLKELIVAYYSTKKEIFEEMKNPASQLLKEALGSLKILQEKYNIFKNKGLKGFALPFKINKKNLKSFIQMNLCKLSLGITEQCNLRCEYCSYSGKYFKERVHSNKFMSFEVATAAIDFFMKISETKRKMINFYGGEPLLAFDLVKEIVNYCKNKYKGNNYQFSLSTNGTLINDKVARFLIRNEILCYISLDGPEDVHDKYRKNSKGKGSFCKIMENLALLKHLNKSYYKENVIFLVTLSPPYDLIKVKNFFMENELVKENLFLINTVNMHDTIFFEDKNPDEWKLEESVKLLKKEFVEALTKKETEKITFHIRYFLKPLLRIHKRRKLSEDGFLYPNGICIPGGRKVFVNTEGEFKICEKLDNFVSIGNLTDGYDYEKIEYLLTKYITFCNDKCLDCWALSLCDLCFVHSNKINDIALEERQKFCENVKRRFFNSIILYLTILERNESAFDFIYEIDKESKE